MTSFITVRPAALSAFAVATITLAAPAAGQSPSVAIDRALRTVGRIAGQPDSAYSLDDRMRYWRVPGVSIAVIDNFRIVHARGYGVTEFGTNTPVDTNTLFQAGSISKPVFATAALALVEQGKLALDEDVNATLTSWRVPASPFNATEKVTLRRLLTHSAGLTVWGFPGYASTVRVPTVVEVLDGKGNTPAVRNDTVPGARWLYSGGGYTVAQLLATDVVKEAFPEFMHRLVLAPAGMTNSTYHNPLPAAFATFAASGHERIDTPVAGRYHTYPEMAAAGLWTTAPDLARWMLDLSASYNGASNRILSPGMARQMIAPHVNTGPRGGNGWQGLGVAVAGSGDSISFGHGGRDEGFVANVVMWPKLGKGLVILTNGVSGALLAEIRRAFNDTYGLPQGPRQERTAIAVPVASLSPLAGRYRAISPNGRDTVNVEVTVASGALTLAQPSARRVAQLWPLGNDQFYEVHSNATFVFQRNGDATSSAASVRLGLAPNAPVAMRVPSTER